MAQNAAHKIDISSNAKTEVRKAVGRDELTEASEEFLNELEAEMLKAAEGLEFERAAALRDRIIKLRTEQSGGPVRPLPTPQATSARDKAKAGGKGGRRRIKPQ